MTLNESTKISLGAAVAVIGGGAIWLTTVALQNTAHGKTLELIEARQIKYMEAIQNIEKDLAIIRTKIEWMERVQRKKDSQGD